MSSKYRSTRSQLRRKMVLPVTVIRHNGREKQLAHTLDLTEISARLGGLFSLLEPREVIEIQRGGVKAKFQVFWMGTAGSAMEGQAGVRSLEPNKNIWGINLPPDEVDTVASAAEQRKEALIVEVEKRPFSEKRWHTRFECSGGASIRAEGSGFPVHGQVKDIAQGGVYVETTTPLTQNTEVYVKMNVEGLSIETSGVVRTSYPLVGMGISFQNISPENQERIDRLIHSIRHRSAAPKNVTEPAFTPSSGARILPANLKLDAYPVRVLASACRALADDFEHWKIDRSSAELDELRVALAELQQKFLPTPPIDQVDFESITVVQGEHA
jgi:PilZ domain